MIKLIVFDLDGTLVDSKKLHFGAIYKVLKKNGFRFTKSELNKNMGLKRKWIVNNLSKSRLRKSEMDNIAREITDEGFKNIQNVKTCPYAGEVISSLARSRRYKLILMTNSDGKVAKAILRKNKLDKYFDKVLAAEHFLDKEHAFRSLFKRLKINLSETLYVGDKVLDYKTAKAVGCKFLLTKSCSWDKGRLNAVPKKYVIRDLGNIESLITKL